MPPLPKARRLSCMNSDTTRGDQVPVLTSRVPRWLHALALVLMGVLVTLVLALVLGYLTAGPGDNLAGVLLVLAALVAVPLLASLLAWSPEARYKVGPRG
jgi:ABC-type transport system involved in cytochrome bd biosynthesis fused ATPase/permease subunit